MTKIIDARDLQFNGKKGFTERDTLLDEVGEALRVRKAQFTIIEPSEKVIQEFLNKRKKRGVNLKGHKSIKEVLKKAERLERNISNLELGDLLELTILRDIIEEYRKDLHKL